VSACLLGVRCRFDGESRPNAGLIAELQGQALLPVCPEQLGGLPTPRPACDLVGGDGEAVLDGTARVVNRHGDDVTANLQRGAEEVLRLARTFHATEAYFKSKSPSCGCGTVKLDGRPTAGFGVCAALLKRNGVILHEVD
jgi:uncharacterized protein YbbK (DUF523 family)